MRFGPKVPGAGSAPVEGRIVTCYLVTGLPSGGVQTQGGHRLHYHCWEGRGTEGSPPTAVKVSRETETHLRCVVSIDREAGWLVTRLARPTLTEADLPAQQGGLAPTDGGGTGSQRTPAGAQGGEMWPSSPCLGSWLALASVSFSRCLRSCLLE